MQDLTEYTKSLQTQYPQHFCPTSEKEAISKSDHLVQLDRTEQNGAVSDNQRAISLPETVQPSDSKKQPCLDLKEESKLRGEDHASTNQSLPEEDRSEESEEEDQTGDGLEEKEDEDRGEAGDQGGQLEGTGRSTEEEMYLGSSHEDDSEEECLVWLSFFCANCLLISHF